MSDTYDPVESLREEVNRFKATNRFTPMLVSNFYIQAGLTLERLDEARRELAQAKEIMKAKGDLNSALYHAGEALFEALRGVYPKFLKEQAALAQWEALKK